jgi:hypothetical protein
VSSSGDRILDRQVRANEDWSLLVRKGFDANIRDAVALVAQTHGRRQEDVKSPLVLPRSYCCRDKALQASMTIVAAATLDELTVDVSSIELQWFYHGASQS